MDPSKQILAKHHFTDYVSIDEYSVAELFGGPNQRGIYILKFANGEYYVGQSVDMAKRYLQHRKTHTDISAVSYLLCPKNKLNEVEQQLIHEFEQANLILRNISLTSIPQGETDLKKLISEEDQEIWLEDPEALQNQHPAKELESHRRKQAQKFKQLEKHPAYEQILDVLKQFFGFAIIEPNLTELDFWRISIPNYGTGGGNALVRLNVYMQETLSIYSHQSGISVSIHLAKSQTNLDLVKRIKFLFRGIFFYNHHYKTGGKDQHQMQAISLAKAKQALDDPDIRTAVKVLNLRLMNKGSGFNKHSHCVDLADAILNRSK